MYLVNEISEGFKTNFKAALIQKFPNAVITETTLADVMPLNLVEENWATWTLEWNTLKFELHYIIV